MEVIRQSKKIVIEPFSEKYRDWATHLLEENWGSTKVVSRGVVHDVLTLAGFCGLLENKPVGLVTYRFHEDQCEIVTIDSTIQGQGIGTALIEEVKKKAIEQKCYRMWLVTTNDNIDALRFYQRKGFDLAAVHRNAIENSRRLKSSIPLVGHFNIPIKHEIEFEMKLLELRSKGED